MKEELKKILRISDLNFSNVFQNFNFEIEAEQSSINCILCFDNSASVLLKIIGNVEDNFQGEINIDNEKSIAVYIPAEASSLPWLNVEENVKFVINNSKYSVDISNEQIKKIIESVGLKGYEKHFPDNRSLGFRFRISLARALVLRPALILIDNSFHKIDDETKFELYDLLKEVSSIYNVSVLLASTDINEAIYLSENIYLVKGEKAEIIERINLKEEWQKLSEENRNNRQIILKEKILKSFLVNDVNNILESHIRDK